MPSVVVAGARGWFAQRRVPTDSCPPLVFVHGAGGTHQHWLYQMRDLQETTAYALDLPGHGRSEGPGRDTIGAYAEWCQAWLDAVGVRRAIWVGHSMGGAVALEVALRWPDRVAALGLVATGARLRVAPVILEGIVQDYPATVRLISRAAFGPEADPGVVQQGQEQMGQIAAAVAYGDFAACNAFDVCDRLSEVQAKAAVLCGTEDRLTPPKYARYLQDHLPDATLTLVDGAGHMLMLEQPAEVCSALRQLLARLQSPTPTAH